MNYFIYILFTVVFISCQNEQQQFNQFGDAYEDIENGKIELIQIGFSIPPPQCFKQLDSLEKYYGVKYQDGGCTTDSLRTIEAIAYNQIVIKYLEKKTVKIGSYVLIDFVIQFVNNLNIK